MVTRRRVENEDGEILGWFDPDSAVQIAEATWCNGLSHISRATGSADDHESLYFTKSGNWILASWSDGTMAAPRYVLASDGEAVDWLVLNEYDSVQAEWNLPDDVLRRMNTAFEAKEL